MMRRWVIGCVQRTLLNTLLVLAFICVMLVATPSYAQQRSVTATATITLTVLPRPGIDFTSSNRANNTSIGTINRSSITGIVLNSASNVLVKLNYSNGTLSPKIYLTGNNEKTLTQKQLTGCSNVEIEYIGS